MTSGNNKNNINRFNQMAHSYDCTVGLVTLNFHQVVLDLVAAQCGEAGPQSILDVGCGTGKLLAKAAACWPKAHITGVDPAPAMVDVARQRLPAATFYVGSAEALPLPDSAVDVVLSTISYHHWADQAAGIRDVGRVLKPGGRFFLADMVMPYPLSLVFRHFRLNDPQALPAYFNAAGLKIDLQCRSMLNILLVTVGLK
jgi:ubiquinone/menaquinone biosynthesis C-methylase UbiE